LIFASEKPASGSLSPWHSTQCFWRNGPTTWRNPSTSAGGASVAHRPVRPLRAQTINTCRQII